MGISKPLSLGGVSDFIILNAVAAPILVFDQHCLLFLNTAAEQLTGCTNAALPRLEDLIAPVQLGRLQAELPPPGIEIELHTTGGSIPVELTVAPLRLNEQTVWLATAAKLTAIRQMEAVLQDTIERFHSILESLDDLVFVLNREREFEDFYQYGKESDLFLPPHQFLGKSIDEIGLPEVVVRPFHQALDALEKSGQVQTYDYQLPTPAGLQWFNARIARRNDANGNYVGATIVTRNITERKQAEDDAREKQRFIEQITFTVPQMIYVYDLVEQRNIYVNRNIVSHLGYTPAAVQQMGDKLFANLLHPDDYAQLGVNLSRFATAQDSEILELENRWRHANGQWHWLYFRETIFARNPDGSPRQVLGVALDITERKQADEALRESEKRLKLTLQAAHAGKWEWNVKTGETTWSDENYRVLGYEPGSCIPGYKSWSRAVHPDDLPERQTDARTLKANPQINTEYRVIWPDGSSHWLNDIATVQFDAEGEPEHVIGISLDITARKQVEIDLRESNERLQALFRYSPDGIFLMAVEGIIVDCSESACQMNGYTREELIGQPINLLNVVPLDDERRADAIMHMRREGTVRFEVEHRRKDGTVFPIENISCLITVEGRELIMGIDRDITERKHAEAALRESNERFQALFEHSPDAIVLLDSNFTIIDCNPVVCAMNGYARHELLGQPIDILNEEQSNTRMRDVYWERLHREGTLRYETNHRRKDGSIFPIEVSTCLITAGGRELILGIDRDITLHHQDEAALRESNERFQTLFEYSPDAIFLIDPAEDIIIDCNETACRMNGYSTPKELIGQSIDIFNTEILDQDGRKQYLDRVRREGSFRTETYHRHKNGRTFPIENIVCMVTIGGREMVMGIDRDITERKRAEMALRESNERFQTLFQYSPDAIFLIDPETTVIVDCNEAACQMNGYPREELVNQPVGLLHAEPESEELRQHNLHRLYHEGPLRFEQNHRRKDGSIFPIENSVCLITLAGHELIMGMDRDITERKQAQQSLLEQERLRIALQKEQELNQIKTKIMQRLSHELRTPLTIIGTSRDLLEYYGERMPFEKRQERLVQIKNQIEHLSTMLTDIELMAKGEYHHLRFQPTELDLYTLCRELLHQFSTTLGLHHHLVLAVNGEMRPVLADKTQIESILINLISNAVKYSPAGSQIELRAQLESDRVVLQVADQGVGIAPEDQPHIFDPFYRGSKTDSVAGLGLGLSIVKDAVQVHGGTIHVNSAVGQGTTFTVQLPVQFPQTHDPKEV